MPTPFAIDAEILRTIRSPPGMSDPLPPLDVADPVQRIATLRARVDELRSQARKRHAQGANGLQVCAHYSSLIESFVCDLLAAAVASHGSPLARDIPQQAALIAVGGTGRGDLAPYSDVDLLFLHEPHVADLFGEIASVALRDCWDAGLKLGHSVRSLPDGLRMARDDLQFATSALEARHLWGATNLTADFTRQLQHRVIKPRSRQFVADCIEARLAEREQFGATAQQLEPDIKRSLGGLRDFHLLRWVGFAAHGEKQIDALKFAGVISQEDARRLIVAQEYLLALRNDLHWRVGKPQDVLNRDEQLRISGERGIAGSAGQLPVERFMQLHFEQTLAVADITNRFIARHRHRGWSQRIVDYLLSYRVNEVFRVGPEWIDVIPQYRETVCKSLEGVLRVYLAAARARVTLAPDLEDAIRQGTRRMTSAVTAPAASMFLQILGCTGKLGATLRSMYATGVLELILPEFRRMRCLLQFNQYHSYTVDEHTLRAVEAAERLEADQSSVGQAYREIKHKELLHLAIILHDAGKGTDEDHSQVGARLAAEVAVRFGLPAHQRDLLMFLVLRHLTMADLAFRRDISSTAVLLNFSHQVGSPDSLRMLYVLTVADITAVGPGVWNEWKAELLTALYDRTMLWLSGKSHLFDESTRLEQIKQSTLQWLRDHRDPAVPVSDPAIPPPEPADQSSPFTALSPASSQLPDPQAEMQTSGEAPETATPPARQHLSAIIRQRLDGFPPHYLLETSPARIAADLRQIGMREPDETIIEANYDTETNTVEYRIITDERVAEGCFHKLTGVLTAKRMEILSAQISTAQDGIIIDSYRVRDSDHVGAIPPFRVQEVSQAIRRVLRGETDVESLLKSRGKFAGTSMSGPVSNLPLRVVLDNESSEKYTVVDVFAHDRPGLLYLIARELYRLQLSVVLAKIATHFDQILDVFFVTERSGVKVHEQTRLVEIRESLLTALTEFELHSDADQQNLSAT